MKRLQTESKRHGKDTADVYDYQSGARIGRAVADWDQYRLWAEGPSDVCQAHRCLTDSQIADLGIQRDTVIFLLE